MYFAGQWIVNLNYWGCNQYITQRALGADLADGPHGYPVCRFPETDDAGDRDVAWYCSLGIVQEWSPASIGQQRRCLFCYPGLLPNGLKGLSIAALTAAIVASLAGKLNSISTIYTLDIHKKYVNKDVDEKKMVWIGRLTVVAAIIDLFDLYLERYRWVLAAKAVSPSSRSIQASSAPGVFAMFILGMFWKRTTGAAALVGVILGFALAIFFNNYAVSIFGKDTLMYTAYTYEKMEGGVVKTITEIPFLINMGWSFVITVATMVAISLGGPKVNPKAFDIDSFYVQGEACYHCDDRDHTDDPCRPVHQVLVGSN